MSRQIEVLPGAHLVASAGGVVVVVAHRSGGVVTADSVAARAMTALLGIVRQATSNEPRRSGRTVARLATNWLMGLANGDADEVEFGVITPGDGGIAVFLHGGVTAVLSGERSEVLRGREAGFTVDRVVTPAPAAGAGLFVDEAGEWGETLPARGVFALGEGTAPGAGAVLWFGGGEGLRGVAPRAPESPSVFESRQASESQQVHGSQAPRAYGTQHSSESQPALESPGNEPRNPFAVPRSSESWAFEAHHAEQPQAYESQLAAELQQGYGTEHPSESQYAEPHSPSAAPRSPESHRADEAKQASGSPQMFESPDTAEPHKPLESRRTAEPAEAYESPYAPEPHRGYDARHAPDPHRPHEVQRAPESQEPYESPYASGPQRAYEPHAAEEPQWGPDLWKRDESMDQATENYRTSPLSRDAEAFDPFGPEPSRYPSVSTHLPGGPANAPRFPDAAIPPTGEPPNEGPGPTSGTPPRPHHPAKAEQSNEDSPQRPGVVGSMHSASPRSAALPHTEDPAAQANSVLSQDDSSHISGLPQRSPGSGTKSSSEEPSFGVASHSSSASAGWSEDASGPMRVAPSQSPDSDDPANADWPTEASTPFHRDSGLPADSAAVSGTPRRSYGASAELSDEDSSAISGTPHHSYGPAEQSHDDSSAIDGTPRRPYGADAWQSGDSQRAGSAPHSSGVDGEWPEEASGPMRVTPPHVALPSRSHDSATPANDERLDEDSALGGSQPRSHGAGSGQSSAGSASIGGTPRSHGASMGWQSAESPAVSSPQGVSSPNLRKGGGAGESEGVAHSGEQPGVARPDQVPVEAPVRNVDLEETLVPDETMVSRVLEHIGVPESPGVVVKGFKCARDHLNDPRVSFCAVCGIRMDQLTCVLTDGVRPPLGLLLLDDGTSFVLDNDCVLGREPEHADAVSRGARPVRLEDASGGMSRAHAEIRLIDWDVTVVDGGSTNGTHVRQPAHQDWTRAIPGHPVKLTPGAQVQLGGRVVTFDSQHGQL
ncbi:FHA domain-containing protein [Nocardia sp. NPDC006044]|uniref:FHA domain-containing protein n=1 Tax=Nocardia sp. NPDC006044 TaxID=3364306 RepID=UPI0036AC3BC9